MRRLVDRFLSLRIPTLALVAVWVWCAWIVATSGWIRDSHERAKGYMREVR